MKVFKYYSSKHHIAICAGIFRVNTFENIRAMDIKKIGDPEEAISKNSLDLTINDWDPNSPLENSLLPFIKLPPGSSNFHIYNVKIMETLPNAYMFCVTRERNDEYWANLEEPYDKCIEILDYYKFSQRMFSNMQNQALKMNYIIGHCFYENNFMEIKSKSTPLRQPHYFRKNPSYEEQNETRTVFELLDENECEKIKPLNIYIDTKDLIKYIN